VLNAAIACSLAKADIKAGAPHALGQASVAQLGVSANTLLQPITDNIPLDQSLAAVKQNLGPVIDAVNKATGGQVDVNKDLKTVTDLLHALTSQQTLAVKLGDSSSELTTVPTSLSQTASAQGATIELLPVSALGGTPVATITIGAAKASATYDRAAGKSSAVFDPALVRVHFAPALGLPDVNVAPGQTITLLAGTPLESTIVVGDGTQETTPTSAKATADGVSLHLLKGLAAPSGTQGVSALAAGNSDGAIDLELAHAEAAVNGTPAVVTKSNPAPPVPPQVKALAFTGTSPWLPVGGMLLIGAAWGTRRLRRRVA